MAEKVNRLKEEKQKAIDYDDDQQALLDKMQDKQIEFL